MLRRSPGVLGLWAGAALLTVATTTVVAGDLATLHRRARALGPERPALVARRDLTLGTTVTPDDVTTRPIHASQLPPGVLRGASAAVGRVVRVPVVRDGFVAARNLAPRGRGLDGVLPAGTRAVRVVVDNGLRPRPGSAVDVYATFAATPDVLGTGRAPGPAPVARSAVVLAADDPDVGPAGAVGVTLLVDEADAPALAIAAVLGPVALVLVPPEDASLPEGLTSR